MQDRFKPHILLFTVNLIYAGNYTVAKLAMPEYISPNAFIVLRAFVGSVVFFLIHSIWIKEKVAKGDWLRMILCGLTGVAINQLMFFKGLALTFPINASLIMILVPMIVMVIAAIFLKERISKFKILGIISGLGGAAVIILTGTSLADLSISKGDSFILINAISYSIYLILVKTLMAKYEPFTVMRWVFFFGFLMVLPFGAHQLDDVQWTTLPNIVWFSILYVLIGTTILTYLLNAIALRIAAVTLVSTYVYLQPLLATGIAIMAGKDELTPNKLLAGALIFIGVYLVSLKAKSMHVSS